VCAGVIYPPCRFFVLSMSCGHAMPGAAERQELYSGTTRWRQGAHKKTTWHVHRGDKKRQVFLRSCSDIARRMQRCHAGDLRAPASV
jgi:hypothetical protein